MGLEECRSRPRTCALSSALVTRMNGRVCQKAWPSYPMACAWLNWLRDHTRRAPSRLQDVSDSKVAGSELQ
eukprot:scaffold164936_cov31-Tisochrysis_lutea.AAC.1